MSYNKVLLIGPRYNKSNEAVGGVVVLFEGLIKFCSDHNRDVIIIDNNMSNYRNRIIGFTSVIFNFFKNINKVNHASLHGTAKDFLLLAPIVVFVSKLFRKKVSLRKFAGNFYDFYSDSNAIIKYFYAFALKRADVVFFETKYLVEKFKPFNDKTYWWANSRNPSSFKKESLFDKKFIFLSQVKKTKGIFEFIEAAESLDDSFTFDVFGPILEDEIKDALSKSSKVNYYGVLEPHDVAKTLVDYDVLILPSFHEGEGYPGIIIECFSCGIPVISTYWNSIPELIDNNYNGFLVPINNVGEIVNSVQRFNSDNYNTFSKNSLLSFKEFESENINYKTFKIIDNC